MNLRQKHFSCPKEVSNHCHAIHQWSFNYVQWSRVSGLVLSCSFGVFDNELINALKQMLRK